MEKPAIGLWSGIVMGVSSKMPRRIIALWFPRLPTDRLQRVAKTHDSTPLVLVAKTANALRITALDRKATALGLTIDQPLANARAMLPEVKVLTADDPADLSFLVKIADWCDRFTPYVALDGPRHLLLDVTGASHLFGGEQAMLDLVRSSLQRHGLAVRAALAGTAATARAVARYCDGTVVASGQEAQAMQPLPVAALNLANATTHALRRAGLKTVGQVAARKRSELVERLGAATLSVLDEALGLRIKPITPRRPSPDYWREQNFAEPIATEELIRTTLKSLAVQLAKTMEQQGQGARRIEAAFFRADGAVRRIAIQLGAPTRDPEILDRLFREKIDTLNDPLDPGFGFDLIRLSITSVERITADIIDFDSDANAKSELNFLIDRLAMRFGSSRIYKFQPHDTHIPEESWIATSAQYGQVSKLLWKKTSKEKDAPRRPLRLLKRPEPIDFATTQQFLWRKAKRILVKNEGPERIAMEWWRHQVPQSSRDYFRVEDKDGKRYWIYRNGTNSQWFLHGAFA
jgi:protein ImuB